MTEQEFETYRRLVPWVVHRLPEHVHRRLSREDLLQAGMVGLLNARRLFRPERGVRFGTFAVHKIRWACLIAAGLTRRGWEPLPVPMTDGIERRLAG